MTSESQLPVLRRARPAWRTLTLEGARTFEAAPELREHHGPNLFGLPLDRLRCATRLIGVTTRQATVCNSSDFPDELKVIL